MNAIHATIAKLQAQADELRARAGKLEEAIALIRKLLGESAAPKAKPAKERHHAPPR